MELKYLSYSKLKQLANSPRHLAEYLSKQNKNTRYMQLGTALDLLLFTPSLFTEKVLVKPSFDANGNEIEYRRNYKIGKENSAPFDEKEAQGIIVISEEEHMTIIRQIKDIKSNHFVRSIALFEGGFLFQDYFSFDFDGVQYRGCSDAVTSFPFDGKIIIVDLKRTELTEQKRITSQIWRESYHLQAAIYAHYYRSLFGCPVEYYLLFQSPVGTLPVRLSADMLDSGRQLWSRLHEGAKRIIADPSLLSASYDFWLPDGVLVI